MAVNDAVATSVTMALSAEVLDSLTVELVIKLLGSSEVVNSACVLEDDATVVVFPYLILEEIVTTVTMSLLKTEPLSVEMATAVVRVVVCKVKW